jgi:hypothetical protein
LGRRLHSRSRHLQGTGLDHSLYSHCASVTQHQDSRKPLIRDVCGGHVQLSCSGQIIDENAGEPARMSRLRNGSTAKADCRVACAFLHPGDDGTNLGFFPRKINAEYGDRYGERWRTAKRRRWLKTLDLLIFQDLPAKGVVPRDAPMGGRSAA